MGKSKIKIDIKELKRLQNNMNKLNDEQVQEFIESVAKELAARLLAKVIKRTPVGQYPKSTGKKGGTLRRGWTAETEANAASGGNVNARDYAQSLTITNNGGVYVIEIVNPVHYASYVEFGHRQEPGRYVPAIGKRLKKSWVEGKFMLTISEDELRANAPKVIERKLKNILDDIFQ